jgi:hypothetical protein
MCTLFRSARSGKNPRISGKVPGDFPNSQESPEKISRNSRKFRPTGFSESFPNFLEFSGDTRTPMGLQDAYLV